MFRDISDGPKVAEDAGEPARKAASLLKAPYLNKRFMGTGQTFHTAEQLTSFCDKVSSAFHEP
eukprot:10066206-Alexandrium_andersonii.AAC.1